MSDWYLQRLNDVIERSTSWQDFGANLIREFRWQQANGVRLAVAQMLEDRNEGIKPKKTAKSLEAFACRIEQGEDSP